MQQFPPANFSVPQHPDPQKLLRSLPVTAFTDKFSSPQLTKNKPLGRHVHRQTFSPHTLGPLYFRSINQLVCASAPILSRRKVFEALADRCLTTYISQVSGKPYPAKPFGFVFFKTSQVRDGFVAKISHDPGPPVGFEAQKRRSSQFGFVFSAFASHLSRPKWLRCAKWLPAKIKLATSAQVGPTWSSLFETATLAGIWLRSAKSQSSPTRFQKPHRRDRVLMGLRLPDHDENATVRRKYPFRAAHVKFPASGFRVKRIRHNRGEETGRNPACVIDGTSVRE